jgi:hypothetical protein
VSPLSLKLIQIGFLVLLWVLVLSVAAVMRSDLFARRRSRSRQDKAARGKGRSGRGQGAVPVPAAPIGMAVTGATAAVGVGGTAGTGTGVAGSLGDGVPSAADAAPSGKPAKPSRPPKPRRGAPRELVVTAGTGVGTRIELGASPISIGRAAENTLVLDDDYVSGRHARFFPHEGAWVVEDLGSTNGTYLDRARLTTPMVVPAGTPVRIGKTTLELRK